MCCHLQGKWEYKEFPGIVKKKLCSEVGVWTKLIFKTSSLCVYVQGRDPTKSQFKSAVRELEVRLKAITEAYLREEPLRGRTFL